MSIRKRSKAQHVATVSVGVYILHVKPRASREPTDGCSSVSSSKATLIHVQTRVGRVATINSFDCQYIWIENQLQQLLRNHDATKHFLPIIGIFEIQFAKFDVSTNSTYLTRLSTHMYVRGKIWLYTTNNMVILEFFVVLAQKYGNLL